MQQKSPIRGLGEVALQVNDLDRMQTFYEDVVGLQLMRRFDHSSFFRIADGYGGHTQILALFDRVGEGDGYVVENGYQRPPLDHFAFEIRLDDYAAELERLASLGADPHTRVFDWTSWRSIFINDPEGNTVEWVCYDESVGKTAV
jgi:catechol-2,3-dioxygenase